VSPFFHEQESLKTAILFLARRFSRSTSVKVIDFCTDGKSLYMFLLLIGSNQVGLQRGTIKCETTKYAP